MQSNNETRKLRLKESGTTDSIVVEAARSVIDFYRGDKDNIKNVREGEGVEAAFDEAAHWVPSDQWLRTDLKGWMHSFGLSPRRTRRCTVEFIGFVECDSGNVGHAGAIYEYKVTGPKETIDELRKALEE